MASHYTRGPLTTLYDFGGVLAPALEHFLLGSHNFMVTALGSCVKWPLGPLHIRAHLELGPFGVEPTWT